MFKRRRTGSNASEGAVWLGGPAANQGSRRDDSVPPKTKASDSIPKINTGTFGEATTASLSDIFGDDVLRFLLKLVLASVAAVLYMNYLTPVCPEPCPPTASPSEVNAARITNFGSSSAMQPTSAAYSPHRNVVSAVKDYGIKVKDYGVNAADLGVKHGLEHGAKYGLGVGAAAAPGLWSHFWSGSKSGQYESKHDPHRTRAWDLVIKRGRNMTTFTSLVSDLEGMSGGLYREFVNQYTRVSPEKFSSRGLVLDSVGHLHTEQSAITAKLNEYMTIRKRAAGALHIHRHPDSDEKQLEASINDLNTLRKALVKVGSELFTYFHVAEKSIGGLVDMAEDLPWQKEKDKWFGAYKYRDMIAAVSRLRQFDSCIKTLRGMITSDIHALG
ncbi:hypothetical protein D6D22_05790 [Aureobasidium pullulans]|uniref:Uncharacterized protein n=1 Tax=Aureobasidium pullulans TaxID=5580 RepID=A0A4V4IHY4_AURPU|nr:hypothetical protein D6D22_05790 [Aureobasidium pullulans]